MPRRTNNDSEQGVAAILQRIEEHLAAVLRAQASATATWLTIHDVARELQVSRDTVERLIGAGELRAAKLSTSASKRCRFRYRIHRSWLNEFLTSQVDAINKDKTSARRHSNGTDFIG